MQVVHQHCAGLDVHKKTVVACLITPKEKGGWEKEIRTFSTMTKDLLNLSDWLTSKGGLVRSEYERCNAILAIKVISVPS